MTFDDFVSQAGNEYVGVSLLGGLLTLDSYGDGYIVKTSPNADGEPIESLFENTDYFIPISPQEDFYGIKDTSIIFKNYQVSMSYYVSDEVSIMLTFTDIRKSDNDRYYNEKDIGN